MKDFIIWLKQFFMPRRRWYRECYLQSDHWRKFARMRKDQSGHFCKNCGAPGYIWSGFSGRTRAALVDGGIVQGMSRGGA